MFSCWIIFPFTFHGNRPLGTFGNVDYSFGCCPLMCLYFLLSSWKRDLCWIYLCVITYLSIDCSLYWIVSFKEMCYCASFETVEYFYNITFDWYIRGGLVHWYIWSAYNKEKEKMFSYVYNWNQLVSFSFDFLILLQLFLNIISYLIVLLFACFFLCLRSAYLECGRNNCWSCKTICRSQIFTLRKRWSVKLY